MNTISLRYFIVLLTLSAAFGRSAAGDVIETFSGNSDNGDWHLTDNPLRSLGIQPTGGDPDAYIRGTVESATPTWYIPLGTATNFLGDYDARQVTGFSLDLNIFVGNQEPNRTLTLDLRSTSATGDQLEAYYIGPDISNNTPGWNHFAFPLDARAGSAPHGWVILNDGRSGTAQDWTALMGNVQTLGIILGQPGFAYTDHTVWDLGLDNPDLMTAAIPEPRTLTDLGIVALALTIGAGWQARSLWHARRGVER